MHCQIGWLFARTSHPGTPISRKHLGVADTHVQGMRVCILAQRWSSRSSIRSSKKHCTSTSVAGIVAAADMSSMAGIVAAADTSGLREAPNCIMTFRVSSSSSSPLLLARESAGNSKRGTSAIPWLNGVGRSSGKSNIVGCMVVVVTATPWLKGVGKSSGSNTMGCLVVVVIATPWLKGVGKSCGGSNATGWLVDFANLRNLRRPTWAILQGHLYQNGYGLKSCWSTRATTQVISRKRVPGWLEQDDDNNNNNNNKNNNINNNKYNNNDDSTTTSTRRRKAIHLTSRVDMAAKWLREIGYPDGSHTSTTILGK